MVISSRSGSRIETLSEGVVFSSAVREPAPVLKRRVLLQRHGHAVGHVEGSETLLVLRSVSLGSERKGLENGEG